MGAHLKQGIQVRRDLCGIAHVQPGDGIALQDIGHRNRMHRRTGSVPGDIEQEDGEGARVELVVSEHVPAQARRRQQDPFGPDRSLGERRWNERMHIAPRALEVAVQLLRGFDLLATAKLVLEEMPAHLEP
jgi:hypothetical protein